MAPEGRAAPGRVGTVDVVSSVAARREGGKGQIQKHPAFPGKLGSEVGQRGGLM